MASMASFLDEIGIVPALCATGASIKKFKEIVSSGLSEGHKDIIIRDDADFEDMLEICRSIGVDIIIGNSKGYYLAKFPWYEPVSRFMTELAVSVFFMWDTRERNSSLTGSLMP